MEVRGERECRDCGTRWSYYETGSVTCPACGSPVSVGVGEPTRHTDGEATLELADARSAAADDRTDEAATIAARAAREYCATRGFISGGDLQPLGDAYVAARELEATADLLGATMRDDEAAEAHFLALLRGAGDGERPADVPKSLRPARGLGVARAVGDYRGEVATWLRDREARPEGAPRKERVGGSEATDTRAERPRLDGASDDVRSLFERLDDHATRVEALDGDVAPADAERLLAAARSLGTYLRDGGESDLTAAREALDGLAAGD